MHTEEQCREIAAEINRIDRGLPLKGTRNASPDHAPWQSERAHCVLFHLLGLPDEHSILTDSEEIRGSIDAIKDGFEYEVTCNTGQGGYEGIWWKDAWYDHMGARIVWVNRAGQAVGWASPQEVLDRGAPAGKVMKHGSRAGRQNLLLDPKETHSLDTLEQ
jgi:hypothetical protein